MKYTVQRPAVIWLETVVEDAASLEDALLFADEQLSQGDYIEIEGTWEIDHNRYWIQTHDGLVFTESFAPAEPRKHQKGKQT